MQIKYIIDSVEWFDKANGNTYASTRVISTATGETVKVFPFAYGNGHNNALLFKRENSMEWGEFYEVKCTGTRKETEVWGE
ncbi:MAG: hypothetical protein ACYCY2_03390 [Acidithiobacillus ferriphilus]